MMEEGVDEDLYIAGYISQSLPVQWPLWQVDAEPHGGAEDLGRVLFPDGEHLADLTGDGIRYGVYRCVVASPDLRRLILAEMRSSLRGALVQALGEQAIDQDDTTDKEEADTEAMASQIVEGIVKRLQEIGREWLQGAAKT